MRELAIKYLRYMAAPYATATRINEWMLSDGHPSKLSSLSSLLKKMTDENVLERIENYGPRGGYGYRLRQT